MRELVVQNKLRTVKINYRNNRNTFFTYRLNIKRSSTKISKLVLAWVKLDLV